MAGRIVPDTCRG